MLLENPEKRARTIVMLKGLIERGVPMMPSACNATSV